MPKTPQGKWSVRLTLLFFLLLGVFYLFVSSGQRGGDTIFSNLYLAIPMLCAASSSILSSITGSVAIFKHKERSPLVFISTGLGLVVLLFILAEISFPH